MWSSVAIGISALWATVATAAWFRGRQRLAENRRAQQELTLSSSILDEERRIMEMMGEGAPLNQVLDSLTLAIEKLVPECRCTILLLDEQKRHLLAGSGGSLPPQYMQAVNGLLIGPDVGACGSAAFRNETVVIEDIATDYRFAEAKDFVMSFGLRACWSVPVRDSKKSVLGTFAMYQHRAGAPSERELCIVEAAAHIVGDVIERLRATERLQQKEARIKIAVIAASLGIWEVDLQSRKTTFSEELAAQLGFARSPMQLTMEQMQALIHWEDWDEVRSAFNNACTNGEAYKTEFRVLLQNGIVRWIRSEGRVEYEEGRPVRLAGVCMDRTEEKEMVTRLEHAMRAKSDFLAHMSHEIRTPLNGVLGMAELAMCSMGSEQQEYLSLLRSSAEALSAIVNDILDYSKMEAGKLTLDPTRIDLRKLVTETVRTMAYSAEVKGLELLIHLDPDLPAAVLADAVRLRQVLLNLIGNAIKFTEKGAVSVAVRCQESDPQHTTLHFQIRDTGVGVPADKRERLFQPFEQADSSITRQYGGTGLGLAISAEIVALMGGQIWMESEVGLGSTFHFTASFGLAPDAGAILAVPKRPHSADRWARSGERAELQSRSGLKILLAEDNPVNQTLAISLLSRMGHHVTLAANGEEAVAKWKEAGGLDVILMDVQMPEVDGFRATARIRASEPPDAHIPIIAMTAHAMAGDRERCIEAGMDDYISKPISSDALQRAIERQTAC